MKKDILETYQRERKRIFSDDESWATSSLIIEPVFDDYKFVDVVIYFKSDHLSDESISLEDLGYYAAEELLVKIELESEHKILEEIFSQELSEQGESSEDWEETKRDLIRFS